MSLANPTMDVLFEVLSGEDGCADHFPDKCCTLCSGWKHLIEHGYLSRGPEELARFHKAFHAKKRPARSEPIGYHPAGALLDKMSFREAIGRLARSFPGCGQVEEWLRPSGWDAQVEADEKERAGAVGYFPDRYDQQISRERVEDAVEQGRSSPVSLKGLK